MFTFALKRLMKDSRFQKNKKLWKKSFLCGGWRLPTGSWRDCFTYFRVLGQEIFYPKTWKCRTCGKCGSKCESGDFSYFPTVPGNPLKL